MDSTKKYVKFLSSEYFFSSNIFPLIFCTFSTLDKTKKILVQTYNNLSHM